jgi:hypothetical protein
MRELQDVEIYGEEIEGPKRAPPGQLGRWPPGHSSRPLLKLTDDEEFSTDVDVGDEGFSVGDYFVLFYHPVFNRALTKQVGTAEGDCLGR